MIGAVIIDDISKNSFQIHFKYKTFAIRNQYGADHTLYNLFTQKKDQLRRKGRTSFFFLGKKKEELCSSGAPGIKFLKPQFLQ